MLQLPSIQIGEPIKHESLTVFPLFADTSSKENYLLSTEALQNSSVIISELTAGGSVPELVVENNCDVRVLFLEGEELIGAKQNRVLNTSVLIPAHSKIKIPVSCVEQGRWSYRTRMFGSAGRNSPSKLRYFLKGSVHDSLKKGMGFRSDQGKVWEEVARMQTTMSVSSQTMALSDTFEAKQKDITSNLERFAYTPGAVGMSVAVNGKIVAIDLFDDPTTCQKAWQRLMTGFILGAVDEGGEPGQLQKSDVETTLQAIENAPWNQVTPVGDGEEYRLSLESGTEASALALANSVIHFSLLTAP